MKIMNFKIVLTGVAISSIIAVLCHTIEFLIASPQSYIDAGYWSFLIAGLCFLFGLVVSVFKSRPNPNSHTLMMLSVLFMVISICFIILYQPMFDCIREQGIWTFEKKCLYSSH